jgi:hypothetical protein
MLVMVVVAFAGVMLFKPETLPPRSVLIVVHGVVMIDWFSLIVMQTRLIRRGSVTQHIRLGRLSVVLALAVVVTGFLVMLGAFARRGGGPPALLNSLTVVTFVILFAAAIRKRRSHDTHKRLMLLASIKMLPPAFTRLCLLFGISQIWFLAMVVMSVLALIVYDWNRLHRVHPATILGVVLILVPFPLAMTVGRSPVWTDFLQSLSALVL